ncbi:hypothetical protein DFH06DRAFT_1127524 [Mycena polygramma]|nr:hypothetical protein DFH06DRAFT_1127524 [Mycena polygramma]
MSEPLDIPIPRIKPQSYRWSNPDGDPEDDESGHWEPVTPPERGLRHRRVEILGEDGMLIEHLPCYAHLVPNPLAQRNIELQLLSAQTATETILACMEMSQHEWEQLEAFCRRFHADPANQRPSTNYEEMFREIRAGGTQEAYFRRRREATYKILRAKSYPGLPNTKNIGPCSSLTTARTPPPKCISMIPSSSQPTHIPRLRFSPSTSDHGLFRISKPPTKTFKSPTRWTSLCCSAALHA